MSTREQSRKPGAPKGRRQMVRHPGWCVGAVLLGAHGDEASAMQLGV